MGYAAVRRVLIFLAVWLSALAYAADIGLIGGSDAESESYIVIAPKNILPASNYTIFVSANPLQPADAVCHLYVEVQCHLIRAGADANARLFTQSLGNFTLRSTDSQRATGFIPRFIVSENYNHCFLILKNKENGEEFERRDLVLSSTQNNIAGSKVLIQLNKPAYKPLDIVRIRIIVLNKYNLPDLDPQNIKVTFSDPNGVSMKRWPNNRDNITMDQNGLVNLDLPLADELVYGTWKIDVSANGQNVTKDFLIERYVLPKFFLKFVVGPKPYITKDTTTITVDVHAMYTYKRALNGRVKLTLLNPKSPNTNTTRTVELNNGQGAFTFHPVNDLGRNLVTEGVELQLHANVSEARTGRSQTTIHPIPVFAGDPFRITWLNPARFYKPGIPVDIQVAISNYDNMPVVDSAADAIKLISKVTAGTTLQRTSLPILLNGIVTFRLRLPPAGQTFDSIKVHYKNIILNIPPPQQVLSDQPTDIYLHPTLEAKPEELQRGSSIRVKIESTKKISNPKVNYILWSGREIVGFRTGLALENGGISVYLPSDETYAQLKLIVYVHLDTGKDSEKIISGTLRIPTNNYLKMRLGATTVEPGTNQSITFETHPESTIAIRGVDQSLQLLSRDKGVNDISPADVPFNPFYHTYREDGSSRTTADSYSDFEESDLLLLTNSNQTQGRSRRHVSFQRASRSLPIAAGYRPTLSDYTHYDGPIRTRSHFPEAWLWEQMLASDFTTEHSKRIPVVPDTITSWYVTALSLNARSGLAVTQAPSLLTVFRPFFITLNLPYSVPQGEQFELQVLIHNYLENPVLTRVTFFNDQSNIRFIDSRERAMENVSRLVTVERATVGTVSFVIMPIVAGDIPLHLEAVADVAGDAIIQTMRVEIPGVRNWNLVKTQLYDGLTTTHTEKYTIQRKRTKRGIQHKLTLSGNPVADSTAILDGQHNVSGMVILPTGCGEQNMRGFARNIMALEWLRANHIDDPVLESKAKKHLETGYQKQITFRQVNDGSFRYYPSANQDATWLTAYVLRCLTAARKYITIDDNVILNGLQFLLKQQNAVTGQFAGTGAPTQYGAQLQGMRSSTSISYGLTAYVTLAIIEITAEMSSQLSRTDKIRYDAAKNKGLTYISSESSLMDTDLYNLILVTTTLAAANHPSRKTFFDKMVRAGKTKPDKNVKWWEMAPEQTPSALTIEMTAYALLAHLWMNQETASDSTPIVLWLLEQKKENGGFLTTQDTVVAFNALSKYAQRTVSGSYQSDAVTIDVLNKDDLLKRVVLNRTTRDAPLEFVLPAFLEDNEFTINVTGKGKAYIQYAELFHNERIANTTNFYDITGMLTKVNDSNKDDVFDFELCLQLRNRSFDASQQVIAEIKLPTGFQFEREILDLVTPIKYRKNNTVEKIELQGKGTKAVIYYTHLNFPKQCLQLPVHIYIKSTTRYTGTVRVTDYYNPQVTDTSTIFPDRTMTVCDICLVSGGCDVISGCI